MGTFPPDLSSAVTAKAAIATHSGKVVILMEIGHRNWGSFCNSRGNFPPR